MIDFFFFCQNGTQGFPLRTIPYHLPGFQLMKWYAFSNCVSFGWSNGLNIICFLNFWPKCRPVITISRDCVSFARPPAHKMICFFKLRIIWLIEQPQNNMLFLFLAKMPPIYYHILRLRIICASSSSWNVTHFRYCLKYGLIFPVSCHFVSWSGLNLDL